MIDGDKAQHKYLTVACYKFTSSQDPVGRACDAILGATGVHVACRFRAYRPELPGLPHRLACDNVPVVRPCRQTGCRRSYVFKASTTGMA